MARLSFEAVQEWRKPEWEGTYHESVGPVITSTVVRVIPIDILCVLTT